MQIKKNLLGTSVKQTSTFTTIKRLTPQQINTAKVAAASKVRKMVMVEVRFGKCCRDRIFGSKAHKEGEVVWRRGKSSGWLDISDPSKPKKLPDDINSRDTTYRCPLPSCAACRTCPGREAAKVRLQGLLDTLGVEFVEYIHGEVDTSDHGMIVKLPEGTPDFRALSYTELEATLRAIMEGK